MHCRSKILDLNACHILPLQIQLSGSFELKLQNFTLVFVPFRRIKKTNEQSLHWSFRFIEISPLALSTQSKIQKIRLIILVSHTHPLKFISAPRKAKHFIGQWIMTADDSIKCQCANSGMTGQVGGFQNPGVCLQVFPSFPPHPLHPFFYLRHFLRGSWLSFLILCSKTKQKRLLHRLRECQKSKRFNEVNMTLKVCQTCSKCCCYDCMNTMWSLLSLSFGTYSFYTESVWKCVT